MHAIEVAQVHKKFGRGSRQVHALRGVSLEVAPGQVFGLLGANGAGKTTLIKILLNLVRPTSGRTSILGVPSRRTGARRAIGYLPEDHRFPDYHTGESALHFYAGLSSMPRRTRRQRIGELLELVNLADARKKKVVGYSKGMKQRLGLAQVLMHDPRVLFLDEPTDGVDPVGRAAIRDTLEQQRDQGKTVLLNSHLLGEVEKICDRVVIMQKGELVRQGTLAELTATGLIYSLQTDPALDDAQVEELGQLGITVERTELGLDLSLEAETDLDRVVDWLRSHSIGVRHLAAHRNTLEDVFLEAVGDSSGDLRRSSS